MEYRFNDNHSFMEKLTEIFESGISPKKVEIYMPHPDHDIEHLVEHYVPASPLKYFTLIGGLTGCFTGFALSAWTSVDWELVTGGKPFFSWPAYTVIGFELTILLGALCSFAGLLILGRLPKFSKINDPAEFSNQFVVITEDEG